MHHILFRRLGILVALLVLAIFIFGQAAEASPTPQGTSLTIGYIGNADSDLARGLQLAINEINSNGGISASNGIIYTLNLEVAPVDDAGDVESALASLDSATAIFGPDDDSLARENIALLSAADVPILTSARSNAIIDEDSNNNIFRLVPAAADYARALASYLAQDLAIDSVAVVSITDDDADNTSVSIFSQTFAELAAPPDQLIQVSNQSQLEARLISLASSNPEAVVIFGNASGAELTIRTLRDNGWDGLLAYQDGQRALLENPELDRAIFAGVIGADNWTFGAGTAVGRTFVANYVTQFGAVPGPLSVAGYDSLYVLSSVIRTGGVSPAVIRSRLSQSRLTSLVAGPINPLTYGNRQLSRTVYVYELTGAGGAQAIAIYDAGLRRAGALDNEGVVNNGGASPTQVAVASATPRPSATPTLFIPSPTPSVLTATVRSNVGALNVRTGPDTIYPEIDELRPGQQVTIAGRNQDYTWYFVQYGGQTGWISAQFVDVFDPGNQLAILPLVAPPPTPMPTASPRPNEADLVITDVTLSPQQPEPNVPVTATITISNQGSTDAGPFAIATSFRPGDVYTASNLSGLGAGQTVTTTLSNTIPATGFVPDLGIIVDLNDQVNEGANGENNNTFIVSYKVDRPTVSEAQAVLSPGGSINFYGAVADMSWDGTTLSMSTNSGSARIGLLGGGLDYITGHYDVVSTYATSTSYGNPQPGQVFAIITDEGDYGYLRIDSRNASNVTFTYRVYQP